MLKLFLTNGRIARGNRVTKCKGYSHELELRGTWATKGHSSISARGTYIRDRDPLEWIEDHAGVRLIRNYYPNFYPTREHFDNAKWDA